MVRRKKIYRIAMSDKKHGKVLGYKLVDARSASEVLKQPKSKYVGRGRYIVGVMPTRLKGTTESRKKMPRSKRFGKGYY